MCVCEEEEEEEEEKVRQEKWKGGKKAVKGRGNIEVKSEGISNE